MKLSMRGLVQTVDRFLKIINMRREVGMNEVGTLFHVNLFIKKSMQKGISTSSCCTVQLQEVVIERIRRIVEDLTTGLKVLW